MMRKQFVPPLLKRPNNAGADEETSAKKIRLSQDEEPTISAGRPVLKPIAPPNSHTAVVTSSITQGVDCRYNVLW